MVKKRRVYEIVARGRHGDGQQEAVPDGVRGAGRAVNERGECEANFADIMRLVEAFHDKFGAPKPRTVSAPSAERRTLREALVREEFEELRAELLPWNPRLTPSNPAKVTKEACDLIYVVLGTLIEFGVTPAQFELAFRAVHESNMAKEGGATRADGKILKPEGWEPPNIEECLK
mgnify:CR=1 FL=1